MIKINIVLDHVERMLTVVSSINKLVAVNADAVFENDLKCLKIKELIIYNQNSIELFKIVLSLIQNRKYFENGTDFFLVQQRIKLGNIVEISSFNYGFRLPPEDEFVLVHVHFLVVATRFDLSGFVIDIFQVV